MCERISEALKMLNNAYQFVKTKNSISAKRSGSRQRIVIQGVSLPYQLAP
jgi:hypothetical protein